MKLPSATGQTRHAARLFGFTFCVMSSFIVCRTIADAVLLTRLGAVALPPMLFLSAGVVGGVTVWWSRQTRALRMPAVVLTTQGSSAVVTTVLLLMLQAWPQSALVICSLYLLAEIRGCLNAILIAVLLNEDLSRTADNGRFALVNAAAPAAGLVIGAFVATEAEQVRVTTLLGCSVLFDVLACLLFCGTDRTAEHSTPTWLRAHVSPAAVVPQRQIQANGSELSSSFANAILWLVVCKVLVLTIVGYEWKVIAGQRFQNDEQSLTAYFGTFYAVSDGLILAIQLLLTRFFLRPAGIAFSLLLLPLYLAALGVASLLTEQVHSLFWLLTFARGSMVIRRGLHDVVLQVLYGWLPATTRRVTVAWVLGVAKPAAEAVAAGGIAMLSLKMPVRTFAWMWVPVLLVWFCCALRLLKSWRRIRETFEDDNATGDAVDGDDLPRRARDGS